jgi:sugar phosphate isomerase/epimerase
MLANTTPARRAARSSGSRAAKSRSPRSPAEDRAVLLEALAELGDHAAQEGVLVLLEPLNRYEDHMINRIEQAVDLCTAVASDAVRVMGDFFHMNVEEANMAASIGAAGSHLKHMHLADSNRRHPGAGHTDFAPAFEALHAIGYDGWLALECHVTVELEVLLAESARVIRPLMSSAAGR